MIFIFNKCFVNKVTLNRDLMKVINIWIEASLRGSRFMPLAFECDGWRIVKIRGYFFIAILLYHPKSQFNSSA